MARNSTTVNAPPQIVFDVLADPCAYEHWVVGNKAVRHFDDAWPAPGAEFHHTVGFGPVATKDKTTVVEAEPARRLVLEARAMPVGIARGRRQCGSTYGENGYRTAPASGKRFPPSGWKSCEFSTGSRARFWCIFFMSERQEVPLSSTH